ncbi:MAG TPA: hypothetical protein VIJ25_17790 [Methylococcales bacterium]
MENPTKIRSVIPNKYDPRDKKYNKLVRTSAPFDWSKGYSVEDELRVALKDPNFKIPIKDQGTSGSCGGQAAAYYLEVLEALKTGVFSEKSAKDIYSQIHASEGGVMPRDVVNWLIKKGICREIIIPSYKNGLPPDEAFMQEKRQTSMSRQDAATAVPSTYAQVVKPNIDSLAQAIRDNHGVILVYGAKDNGTMRSADPVPSMDEVWAHFEYHCTAKIHNGAKKTGAPNSWGTFVGESGWQWWGSEWLPHYSTIYLVVDPINPALKTTDLQKITLIQQLLNVCYQLFAKLTGYSSKSIIN